MNFIDVSPSGHPPLATLLGIKHPIIQAPMAGGGDTVELVASVADAGAFGFVGAAYLSPEEIVSRGRALSRRSGSAFGVNLFVPTETRFPSRTEYAAAAKIWQPLYDEFAVRMPDYPLPELPAFADQFAAAIECGARCLSFTFGCLPKPHIARAHAAGMVVLGTATTIAEAVALQQAGVDAVVLQSAEAGGHRGAFLHPTRDELVPGIRLFREGAAVLDVPTIASGGIMDGRGIAAAMVLGAVGVQMGTAFLATPEAGASPGYKRLLGDPLAPPPVLTRVFSGRDARGLPNRITRLFSQSKAARTILPFPYQNALTRPLRAFAAANDLPELLSLWAGDGAGMTRPVRAADLIKTLVDEVAAALAKARAGVQ